MRVWVNSDNICEDTRNILGLLSAPEFTEFHGLSERIILLEKCLDEEEYDDWMFSDTAFALLKVLLKIRLKLRRIDPRNNLIQVLSLVIDEIRKQLKLNEKYMRESFEVDMFLCRVSAVFRLSVVVVASLLMLASVYAAMKLEGLL